MKIVTDLSQEWNPINKPSHGRNKPKRGQRTKFSPKVRKAIIERDGGLCVCCKRPYVNIHHIEFASSGGMGTVDNGVCVCFSCHSWAHSGEIGRKWFERYRKERLIETNKTEE